MSGTQDRVSLRVGTEEIDAARAKFEAFGPAGDRAMGRIAEGGKAAAYQSKQLALQMGDVFTSISTGAPITQVFLQQGAQIQGIYGSAGATLRGITTFLGGPYVLGMAAAGAAVAVLASRSSDLINEQRQLDVALRGVGRTAEVSAASLANYIRVLERQGVARDAARGIAGDLARTQGLSGQNAGRVAALAPDLATTLGTDASAAAKQLAEFYTGGYDGVRKLDEALNFLSVDQRQSIRFMLEHGDRTKAFEIATEALAKQISGLSRDALSPMGTALRDLSRGWASFMDEVAQSRPIMALVEGLGAAVSGMGAVVRNNGGQPAKSLEQQIAEAQADLTAKNGVGGPFLNVEGRARTEARLADLRARQVSGGDAGPMSGMEGASQAASVSAPAGRERARLRKLVDDNTLSSDDQARLLTFGPTQRAAEQARIQAAREAGRLGIPAGDERDIFIRKKVAEVTREQADAAAQNLAAITREGQGALAVAAASTQGQAAMLRASAAAEAHAQAATQAGVAENALTAAILNRNAAQEAKKGADAILALDNQNAAVTRLIEAEKAGDRAAYYGAVENKVIDATRALAAHRDVATDQGIRDALQKEIDLTGERIREQERLNAVLAQTRRMSANDNELADLRDQTQLVGASAAYRDRELATRRAIRQLQKEGEDPANLTARAQAEVAQAAALADAKTSLQQQQGLWEELGSIGSNAAGRLGDAMTQAAVSGERGAIRWGNVFRGVVASATSDLAKLAVLNPLSNAVFGTSRPSLFSAGSAAGGGGGGGGLGGFSFGGLFGEGGVGGALGLTGAGGLLSTPLWGGSIAGPTTAAGIAASGAPTLGSLLGPAGAGFGVGMFVNSLLGGNQLGGGVGSGVGAIGGALLGSVVGMPWLGALLGGAAGGGLGGMIGPGPSVKSYGLRLQSAGFQENGANGLADSLLPVSRQYYNESGAAVFQQADQVVAAVNAYLSQRGLQVGGVSIIGGNKNGPDGSGDAGSVSEAFTRLRFSSKSEAGLSAALGAKTFDDPAKLQEFVEGFYNVRAAISDLTDTADQKLQKSLEAIGKQFDDLSAKAKEYGLSESGLADAREKALKAVREQADSQSSAQGAALLRDLAFGNGSVLAPEQQYFAAISTLNTARSKVDAGGGLEDYTAAARQVLPIARDFLGVTERYASLVSEVAGVVTAKGGDPAGLGALLQAQADGSDALRDTFAHYGEQQVQVATATLTELRRLASSLEALIARRVA